MGSNFTTFRCARQRDQRMRLVLAQEILAEILMQSNAKEEYWQEIITLVTELEKVAARNMGSPSCTELGLHSSASMFFSAGKCRLHIGDHANGEKLMWRAIRMTEGGVYRVAHTFMFQLAGIYHERVGGLFDAEALTRENIMESGVISFEDFLKYNSYVVGLLIDQGKIREAWAFAVDLIYQALTRHGRFTIQMGAKLNRYLNPFWGMIQGPVMPDPKVMMVPWESEADVEQELQLLRNRMRASTKYDPVKAIANLKKTVQVIHPGRRVSL